MKKILLFAALFLLSIAGFSQSKGYLRYDTVYIQGSLNGELVILNGTRDSTGFLFNAGGGRTIFKRALKKLNDTTYLVGGDTLKIGVVTKNSFSALPPLVYNPATGQFSLPVGNGSVDGYLSHIDWLAFSTKQSVITWHDVTVGSSKITLGGTPAGAVNLGFSIDVNEAALTLGNLGGTLPLSKGGTGAITQANALNNILPDQTGKTSFSLVTDGTNASWQSVSGGGGGTQNLENVVIQGGGWSGNHTSSLSGHSWKFDSAKLYYNTQPAYTNGGADTLALTDLRMLRDSMALARSLIPTLTSQLTNDASFIAASGAPVQSVNGQTGVVVINGSETKISPTGTNVTVTGSGTVGDPYVINSSGGGGSSTFASLTDVAITSPTANQIPVYNSGTSKWTNTSISTSIVSEGTNLYWTNTRFDTRFGTSIASWRVLQTTDSITEGVNNLYFTTARARAALSNTSPITYSAGAIGIQPATISQNGYFAGTDFTNLLGVKNKNLVYASSATTNGVQGAFRALVNADLPTSGVTPGTYNQVVVNAQGVVTGGTANAYITGNQTITLSGDGVATGTTALTLVLNTVNSNVGSFGDATHIPVYTVNAKGLVTASSSVAFSYIGRLAPTDSLARVSNGFQIIGASLIGQTADATHLGFISALNEAYLDSLRTGLKRSTINLGHPGVGLWSIYASPLGDSLYGKNWHVASGLTLVTQPDSSFLLSPDFSVIATVSTAQTISGKTFVSPIINLGSDATGDTYYRNSGGLLARRPIGTAGQVYRVVGGIPVWVDSTAETFTPAYKARVDSGLVIANKRGSGVDSLLYSVISITPGVKDSLYARGIQYIASYGIKIIDSSSTGLIKKAFYVDSALFVTRGWDQKGKDSLGLLIALKANIASPAFTGIPTAPSATFGTNTTQLATTQFVQSAVAGAVAGVSSFNTRTGAVTATNGDYNAAQITNAVDQTALYPNPTWITALAYSKLTGVSVSLTSAVTGILSVANGGTGAGTLSGYVKGNGVSAFTAVSAIPGTDISGNISGSAAGLTATLGVTTGGTGAITLSGYVKGNGTSAMTAVSSIPGTDISGNISGNAANIIGNIPESQVTSLVTDLAAKAPLVSPALTGTPSAPTAVGGTNTTQVATTQFVQSALTSNILTTVVSAAASSGAPGTISGNTLSLKYAGSGSDGIISASGTQHIPGEKIFDADVVFQAPNAGFTPVVFGASGTSPTTPPDGGMWYDNSLNGLFFNDGGTRVDIIHPLNSPSSRNIAFNTSYTAATNDYYIFFSSATTTTVTLTLPTSANGKVYSIFNPSAHAITLSAPGLNFEDAQNNFYTSMPANTSWTINFNSGNSTWYVVTKG